MVGPCWISVTTLAVFNFELKRWRDVKVVIDVAELVACDFHENDSLFVGVYRRRNFRIAPYQRQLVIEPMQFI